MLNGIYCVRTFPELSYCIHILWIAGSGIRFTYWTRFSGPMIQSGPLGQESALCEFYCCERNIVY